LLRLDFEAAPNDRQDRLSGFTRGLGDIIEEARIVDH
jgi:hypothetical protein